MATKYSLSVTEAQKRKRKRLRNQAKRAKEKLAQKINGQKFVFKTKADEKGTLYAKFDNKVIAHKLKEKGVNVEATEIDLSQSIKKIGEYKLHLKLGSKSATIKLKVES
jgi:ribosomal protein L9